MISKKPNKQLLLLLLLIKGMSYDCLYNRQKDNKQMAVRTLWSF